MQKIQLPSNRVCTSCHDLQKMSIVLIIMMMKIIMALHRTDKISNKTNEKLRR